MIHFSEKSFRDKCTTLHRTTGTILMKTEVLSRTWFQDILSGTLQRYEILHSLSCNPSESVRSSRNSRVIDLCSIFRVRNRNVCLFSCVHESITEFYRVVMRTEIIVDIHKRKFDVQFTKYVVRIPIIFSKIAQESNAIVSFSRQFFSITYVILSTLTCILD